MPLSNVEKALKMATKLNFWVFPWKLTTDGRKIPLTPHGHLDSSNDPEQIATWFGGEYATANIGVHVGKSGLLVADIDLKEDKNGFEATDGWLDFPTTFETETGTGGKHYIYAAPEGIRLAPSGNFQGFRGLDTRGGSSWIAWWSDTVPDTRDVFKPAPAWLCEPAKETPGAAFEGELDDWLNAIPDHDEEPGERVIAAIQRIPDGDFGRFDLLDRQFEFVRLAAEGAPGVMHGLRLLRDAWLRGEWDTDDCRYTFDKGLDGAIRKAGALEARIANLPDHKILLQDADTNVVNALVGFPGDNAKGEWFRAVNTCIRFGYTDDQVLALVWNLGRTKGLSRDWGVEFCGDRIVDARKKLQRQDAEAEREIAKNVESNQPEWVEAEPVNHGGVTLLTDAERRILDAHGNFIRRYVAHAEARFDRANAPYHAANAWTILSLVYGNSGFVPMAGKTLGLNLFQMTLGESSTGKSDSIILRQDVLRNFFADDLGFDVGAEASPEMLHEEMLLRAGEPTFFNTDEAAGFFGKLAQHGSWSAGLEDKITDWYGGWVGPVTKRAAKATLKDANKGGPCYLVNHFFATPERLFSVLDREQFLSGFLARFQWSIGFPASEDADRHVESQTDAKEEKFADRWVEDLVTEFRCNREHVGVRRPVKGGNAELSRLTENRKAMEKILRAQSDWKITESAYRRLCDALRKCVALLALSRGSTTIEMVDVLGAVEQAETWVAGLVEAASRVSSSAFEREAREIAYAVRSLSASNGFVTAARLRNRFARYEPREYRERLEWGDQMGLIGFQSGGGEHKDRWYWKGGEDD